MSWRNPVARIRSSLRRTPDRGLPVPTSDHGHTRIYGYTQIRRWKCVYCRRYWGYYELNTSTAKCPLCGSPVTLEVP